MDSIEQINYLKKIVYFLASDSLYGRETSSISERKAADFIYSSFKDIKNLKPKRHCFSFQRSDSSAIQFSQNIYCYVNNHADSTILIGAHYDHIGMGGELSLAYSKKNQIHNGADDNASGVALMLSMAQSAQKNLTKNFNYAFVAYSAHEIGLYGSTAFYSYIKPKIKPLTLMVNFDMVGRLDVLSPVLSVFVSTKTGSEGAKYFEQKKGIPKIKLNYDLKIVNSDCRIFVANGIESLSFTTGIHTDYHKPTDDAEKLNLVGMLEIYKILVEFINR